MTPKSPGIEELARQMEAMRERERQERYAQKQRHLEYELAAVLRGHSADVAKHRRDIVDACYAAEQPEDHGLRPPLQDRKGGRKRKAQRKTASPSWLYGC